MTTADPGRSPAGTESLWAYTHLPHRAAWAAEEIAAHAERMEEVLEEHAPGFGRLVRARHVAGPADLEAENPSLVGGAIGGGHRGGVPAAVPAPGARAGPGGHADRPALPGQRVGPPGRRGARRAGRRTRRGRRWPGTAP